MSTYVLFTYIKKRRASYSTIICSRKWKSKIFLGTDSAPHPIHKKESKCGCAGIYTSHAAIELCAEAFDSVGKLDKLENFTAYLVHYFTIYLKIIKIKLIKSWKVPDLFKFGSSTVKPLRANELIYWTKVS